MFLESDSLSATKKYQLQRKEKKPSYKKMLTRRLLPSTSRLTSSTASSLLLSSSSSQSFSQFRFCQTTTATTTTTTRQQQQELSDISPPTPAESKSFSQEVEDARIERFVDDMYTQPVFSPLVMLLTVIGFGGFILTWGYFVATPVYLAHVGKSSEESGSGGDGKELD